MKRSNFQGKELSLLGFGAMRLPLSEPGHDTKIDEDAVNEMLRYAHEHGVNYYDTAYPYHGGESERVMGKLLKQFPRDSYYLATKYPGHQIAASYNPSETFNEQLTKCGVDYFDFYLLHNIYEDSLKTYKDPRWGIVDYFIEQKRLGKIHHLGFSCHGGNDNLKEFLDLYGEHMEFGQIQLNYLDWTLQDAKGKYDMLTERGIPVWVMEPVRGGKLAKLSDGAEAKLKSLRPNESIASWAFRWLQNLPNVTMILSGMSNLEQMKDNVKTFSVGAAASKAETELLFEIAEGMKDSLPCTACRYCVSECPQSLDIPMLIDLYNQLRFAPSFNISMRTEALPEDKRPSACIACGACSAMCPQHIDIPAAMSDFAERISKLPSWSAMSKQREEAAKKMKA